MKLGVFEHLYESYYPYKILVPYTSWFLIYDHKYFEYFVKVYSISIYTTNCNFVLH